VRACIQGRFGGDAVDREPLTGLPGDVRAAYRRYWAASLLRQKTREQAESALLAELHRLTGVAVGPGVVHKRIA